MKPKFSRLPYLASIVVSLGLGGEVASAASGNWTLLSAGSGSGSWNTATNWSSNPTIPGSATDDVVDFSLGNITADSTVTMDGNRTVGTLIFGDATTASNNWTLSNGSGTSLTLSGTSNPVINVVNQTASISALVTGSSGFTKTGTGKLVFINNGNTLTGVITVTGGSLQIGNLVGGGAVAGRLGSGVTSVVLSSGTSFIPYYNGGTPITTVISGAGGVSADTGAFGAGAISAGTRAG